jgi:hypothetical protein
MKYSIIVFFAVIFLIPGYSIAQKANKKLTITGTVVGQDKRPVDGAVIFIDKVKTNSITDQNGRYSVKVKPGASEILVFTLLKGSGKELINGRTIIDFVLEGTPSGDAPNRPEQKMTSSSKVLDGRDPEFSSYQNIYDMIRGRFPGVEVNGKSIKVMGSSSLNVSTEPLFVVDGVVVKSLDDIVPQTVNTIEVLKGPDATAWGTRGANGVIVITRRKD